MIKGYVKIVNKASRWLENIAALILFLTTLLVIVNVISRALFNTPVMGTYDLVLFFTTIIISFSIAYCAVKDGHIAINVFIEKFPKKIQKVIDVIIGLVSAIFLFLVSWQLVQYANEMRATGEVSLTIGWPHYPFVILVSLGFFILGLVIIGKTLSLFIKEGDKQ